METTWRTGPIVVTGATGRVGHALTNRLAAVPNKVLTVDRDADLKAAMAQAQVVVHLAGALQPRRPNTSIAANLDSAHATAAALQGSAVQRVVFLSFLTASHTSDNDYLRTEAAAERVLEATGIPTVVFRTGHIFGPPTTPGPMADSLLARHGNTTVIGPGTQRLQPILLDDVVEAIVRAGLDAAAPAGTFELAGPEAFTVDELARMLNGEAVSIRHLPAWLARVLAWVVPSMLRPLVDVLLSDAVASADVTVVAHRFGFDLHEIGQAWSSPATDQRSAAPR